MRGVLRIMYEITKEEYPCLASNIISEKDTVEQISFWTILQRV